MHARALALAVAHIVLRIHGKALVHNGLGKVLVAPAVLIQPCVGEERRRQEIWAKKKQALKYMMLRLNGRLQREIN